MKTQIKRIHTVLLVLATLSMALGAQLCAHADQFAKVSDNNIDLRYQPNINARSKARLYAGRTVLVNDQVDGWVHVSFEIEHGRDVISMDGWLPVDHVRAPNGKPIKAQSGVTKAEPKTQPKEDTSADWTSDLNWSNED